MMGLPLRWVRLHLRQVVRLIHVVPIRGKKRWGERWVRAAHLVETSGDGVLCTAA